VYINGVLDSSTASFTGNPDVSVQTLNIGDDAGPDFFKGSMDDIGVWYYNLSAKQIYQMYLLSQQGYPGVLRRMETMLPQLYNQPSGATAITPWWIRGMRVA